VRTFRPDGQRVTVVTTDRDDGDFAVGGDPDELQERREAVCQHPWVWLRQVHGARVVVAQDDQQAGQEADAVVTSQPDLALVVQTADCAPVVFWGPEMIGIAHAGWQGLMAGVLEATVAEMTRLDDVPRGAAMGPCISPAAYEFGERELARIEDRYGHRVVSRTTGGRAALDLRAAVTSSLAAVGVAVVGTDAAGTVACTASDPSRFYSHRARRESGRQATVIWKSA
jgi:YfiH family protein